VLIYTLVTLKSPYVSVNEYDAKKITNYNVLMQEIISELKGKQNFESFKTLRQDENQVPNVLSHIIEKYI
jgi:tRNA U38,U39,U40 pseudouridine synthase TruA